MTKGSLLLLRKLRISEETWRLLVAQENGHMINVLVQKLPAKVGHDWAEHKQSDKLGTMASEEKLCYASISGDKSKTHSCYVTGQTCTIQQQRDPPRQPKNGEKRFGRSEPLCIT